jgi:hypothetical protein
MALTRKFLAALGIDESKIESIIDAHTETVDALKGERDRYKADAEKLPEVQKELDKAKAAAKDSGEYDRLKKEYEDYKAEVANKETLANKKAAFRKVAKDAGLTDTGIEKAAKYQDYSAIELDEKGEIKNAKDLMKSIKDEWPEHVATSEKKGAVTPTPPAGSTGGSEPGKYSDIRGMTAKWHASKYGEAPKTGADNGAQNN